MTMRISAIASSRPYNRRFPDLHVSNALNRAYLREHRRHGGFAHVKGVLKAIAILGEQGRMLEHRRHVGARFH